MNRKNITTTVVVVMILVLLMLILKFIPFGKAKLADPGPSQQVAPSASPETPSYNPPPEVKFDSTTDLKKELELINPQVLDSDFE